MIGAVRLLLLVALSSSAQARDLTLPDPVLTPGVVTNLTTEEVCGRKWGRDARHVTQSMKRDVFARYGLSGNNDPVCQSKRRFEIDHLVSRELGGADVMTNLWPQCYGGPWNAAMKDRAENRAHKEVCAGNLALEGVQAQIATDWRVLYRLFFGAAE